MLTNFFAKSKPVSTVVLITLFFVFFFTAFFNGKIVLTWFVIPLFLVIFGIVNFINHKNNLTFDNSFAFLFFVLLLGFFPKTMIINNTFYANLTLLLVFRKVYSLQSSKTITKKLFDAGFWLGISFLIEPFIVIFSLLLYASLYLHQQLTIKRLLTPLLGFLPPVFLFFTYCFWYDKIENFNHLFAWSIYDFGVYDFKNNLFALILLGVFLLLSIVLKTPKALAVKNSFRKTWMLILLHLALSILLFSAFKNNGGNELLFILFPSAIILANGIELYQKKIVSNIFLVAFLITSVIMCIV